MPVWNECRTVHSERISAEAGNHQSKTAAAKNVVTGELDWKRKNCDPRDSAEGGQIGERRGRRIGNGALAGNASDDERDKVMWRCEFDRRHRSPGSPGHNEYRIEPQVSSPFIKIYIFIY
jgi:hypothetical protein